MKFYLILISFVGLFFRNQQIKSEIWQLQTMSCLLWEMISKKWETLANAMIKISNYLNVDEKNHLISIFMC